MPGSIKGYTVDLKNRKYYKIKLLRGNGELKVLNNGIIAEIYENELTFTSLENKKIRQKTFNNIAHKYSIKTSPIKNSYVENIETSKDKHRLIIRKGSENMIVRIENMVKKAYCE